MICRISNVKKFLFVYSSLRANKNQSISRLESLRYLSSRIIRQYSSLNQDETSMKNICAIQTKNKIQFQTKNKIQYQKAYLASQIIKLIMMQKKVQEGSTNIHQLSLREKIIKLIDDKKIIQKEVKIELLQIFQGGINVDSEIYGQKQRLQQTKRLNAKGKVIFCPNLFITSSIFRKLIDPFVITFIQGHYGISKTISSILFQKLSNYIVDYRLTAQEQLPKQIIRVPKIIYWSIHPINNTLELINKYMNFQLSSIQRRIIGQKVFDKDIKVDSFQIYSEKNIPIVLLVDHLNALISEIRQSGYTKQMYWEKQMYQQNTKYQEIERIIKIQKILQSKFKFFNRIVYLSSMNMEKQYLNQLRLTENSSSYKEKVEHQIQFMSLIQQQAFQSQLIDFFIFQIFQRYNISCLSKSQYSQNQLKQSNNLTKEEVLKIKLKSHLLQITRKKVQFFMLNQNGIISYFSKQQMPILMKLNEIKNQKQLFTQLQNLFISINKFMEQELVQKIWQFLNDNKATKLIKFNILFEIVQTVLAHKQAYKSIKDTKQPKHSFEFQFKDSKFNEQSIKNHIDRQLFSYSNGVLKLLFPPHLIIKLNVNIKEKNAPLPSLIFSQIAQFHSNIMIQQYIDFPLLQTFSQQILIQILSIGNSSLNFGKFYKSAKFGQKDLFLSFEKFENISKNLSTFQPIPKSNCHKIYSFFEGIMSGLKQLIAQSQNYSNQDNVYSKVFLPLKSTVNIYHDKNSMDRTIKCFDSVSKRIDSASKCIDFAVVKFDKNNKFFQINAIDATIGTNILQKITNFLNSYQYFADKNETEHQIHKKTYSFELNYYVLGNQFQFSQILPKLQNQDYFKKTYYFTLKQPFNLIQVDSKDKRSDKALLHYVGYHCLPTDVQVHNSQYNLDIIFKTIVTSFSAYIKHRNKHLKQQQ